VQTEGKDFADDEQRELEIGQHRLSLTAAQFKEGGDFATHLDEVSRMNVIKTPQIV
jgi:hypothetical protein